MLLQSMVIRWDILDPNVELVKAAKAIGISFGDE